MTIFSVPELHAEKMNFMTSAGEPHGKFPYSLFHSSFYIRVDGIVDKSDLHPADLQGISILIEEHHTLEYRKEKDLDSAYDQHKGYNCCGDFRQETEIC